MKQMTKIFLEGESPALRLVQAYLVLLHKIKNN